MDDHICTTDCGCDNGQCNCGKNPEDCEVLSGAEVSDEVEGSDEDDDEEE